MYSWEVYIDSNTYITKRKGTKNFCIVYFCHVCDSREKGVGGTEACTT